MKKSNILNILLVSVGIIVGAYKYIEGGFHWYIGANIANVIMMGDIIYFIIVSILAGMCSGFGVKIAKTARRDEIECKMLIKSGFWIVLLLSIGMLVICSICQEYIIYCAGASPEVLYSIDYYLEMYMKGFAFTTLFSYILMVIRALGNYKIPCLFIVCAVMAEWGMIKILMSIPSFPVYYLPYIANAKVLINIVVFLIAVVYFRVKYARWCRMRINIKIFLQTLVQFVKEGGIAGMLGLPLGFMALIEIKKYVNVEFLEATTYNGNILMLGTVIMAPLMARLLVKKYVDD